MPLIYETVYIENPLSQIYYIRSKNSINIEYQIVKDYVATRIMSDIELLFHKFFLYKQYKNENGILLKCVLKRDGRIGIIFLKDGIKAPSNEMKTKWSLSI